MEEDRFMRDLEAKYIHTKQAERAAQEMADNKQVYTQQITPVMIEAELLLQKSGNIVSSDGLEALAKWKLGL